MATHDVEFAATTCDRTVLLAQGEVVADGATAELLCPSPTFAPQVARVMAPAHWLDVDDLVDAVAAERRTPDPAVVP